MSRARERWLKARRKGLGSSDAPAVLGVSSFASPLDVYADKRGLVPPFEGNAFTEAGKRLEPVIAKWAADELGLELSNPGAHRLYRHPKHATLFATPDRVITHDPERPGERGILELKNTNAWRAEDWDEEPPIPVQVQVQHQIECTREKLGATFGRVAVLIGGNDLRFTPPIDFNRDFCAVMVEKELRFWIDHVEAGVPPQPAKPSDVKTVAKLWPNAKPGAVVELPVGCLELDEELQGLKAERSKADKRIKELEAQLRFWIADAETGLMPGGAAYTLKETTRKGYTVEDTTYRTLRRKKARK